METNQYLDVFLDESREHLQAINDHTLRLENEPQNEGLVNEIFRSAHTLKGMAATMGYEDIASLTHKMENVLDLIRNKQLQATTEVIDIIFIAIEYLEEMVEAISNGQDGKKDVTELVARLDRFEKGEAAATAEQNKAEGPEDTATVPVNLDEFQMTIIEQGEEQGFAAYQIIVELSDESILKGARAYMVFEALEDKGEVIKTIPATEDIEEGNFDNSFELIFLSKEAPDNFEPLILKVSEIRDVVINRVRFHQEEVQAEEQEFAAKEELNESNPVEHVESAVSNHQPAKTIRVNLDRIDDLLNLFEEVVIDQSRLNVVADGIKNPELTETVEHMNRVSSDMQSLILAMRMVPIEQVFNRFPRMVRGLARDLEKKINLEIIGADTELDRTVIDEIGDPLVHLIRNSVDHGIERPEERRNSGKAEEGNVVLRAFHSGNHVFIEIEDDGAGINLNKVKKKAIDNGIITAQEADQLSEQEVSQLILESGFSTAETVSSVSGRGVGLDVVKNKIESLGGSISIESTQGEGSIFSIQLPLTLSIITTLLVKSQEETYAIPLSSIIETVLLQKEQIMTSHGQKVMDFRGQIVPLLDLQEVLAIPELEAVEKEQAVVVMKKGDKLTGLVVDHLIGQQELVLKSLGDYLGDVFAISGATILGDGQVALIIDPNALIK
ncbi:chemotaxis protein CheA [Oceanobacillus indicireducens]|uniref:Chemotaxis protein CheA n=1 Tax=Oceanobacillus indicireducens TaxID=1004261 RepID=A0A918CZU3_9BACI|nr:chemotaxis protein CheA [Oceanobacillus indicireducens]GGN53513.1 chemotaxis protein CheA [Oceanobacillus indicireducens]